MNSLACFYTESKVSELLVSNFRLSKPQSVIDLGAGFGSLLKATLQRWTKASVYAAEIDTKGYNLLRKNYPQIKLVCTDGLKVHKCTRFNVKPGSIDIAVCNPPYLRLTNNLNYDDLFNTAGLPACMKLRKLTSDIVFLAQNLRLLREGGELGIILPDSLITGHEFEELRKNLLERHEIFGVIQMPDKLFYKTEALTHILLIRKGGNRNSNVPIYKADHSMKLSNVLNIPLESLHYRMDYDYWAWFVESSLSQESVRLGHLGADIRRGSLSLRDCERLRTPSFHTSDFPRNNMMKVNFPGNTEFNGILTAEKGDILLARVGKRCIGRVTKISSGKSVITDCVYRIRVQGLSSTIWHALRSKKGQAWLRAHAHGVCAQVISKQDLLNFPVNV